MGSIARPGSWDTGRAGQLHENGREEFAVEVRLGNAGVCGVPDSRERPRPVRDFQAGPLRP